MLYYIVLYYIILYYIILHPGLPKDAIVRLSHSRSGDRQDQETFLAPSEEKQIRNYDIEFSNHYPSHSSKGTEIESKQNKMVS